MGELSEEPLPRRRIFAHAHSATYAQYKLHVCTSTAKLGMDLRKAQVEAAIREWRTPVYQTEPVMRNGDETDSIIL